MRISDWSSDVCSSDLASEIRTRSYGAYEVNTSWAAIEEEPAPTVFASRAAYEAAGIGPDDVDVIQLQDTDAGAEVIHMAENGFCADGDQEKLLADGATEIGGPLPIDRKSTRLNSSH